MGIKLIQLELEQGLVNCGMSYVFKLGQSEFFIIDGGFFTPGEDDRLLELLQAESAGVPRVRGWLFTHAHQDHLGCFMNMMKHHRDQVQVDQLLFQFQPMDFSGVTGSWQTKCNDLATVQEFYAMLAGPCGDIPVHRLETGEILRYGELELEVLYTADEILPLVTSFNDYSAVLQARVGQTRLLFLGDVQKEGSRWLLANKADKLKSDFVQVAHHGFNGATGDLYRAIAPRVALFPTPDYEYETIREREANRALLNCPSLEEIYVSGHGTAEFDLPYIPGTARVQEKRLFARLEK